MVGTLISGQPTLAFIRNSPSGKSNKLSGKYTNGFSVYSISQLAIIRKIESERLRIVDNLATESSTKDNSWGDEWDKMVAKHSLLAISSEFEDTGSMDDALLCSKRQVIMAALIFALCSGNRPSYTAEAAEDNDGDSTKQFANSSIVSDIPKQSVPNKSIFAGLLNTQSWYQFRGEGFSVRVPPNFDDLTEPEDYSAGSSLYGERAKPKTFAARFASPDGSEVLSVVVRPSTQLKLTFLEAQDISDLGSLRDAASLFVPGGATLFAARTIKVKDSDFPRTYYFYEFSAQDRHVALEAAVSRGKVFVAGASAPRSKWEEDGSKLRSAAISFSLV